MKHLVAPSILSSNFLKLSDEIEIINKSRADWFHIDIMDGVFVPNITFGMPILKQISSIAQKPLDVHLMIVQPERYLKEFKECGANILTVHYESITHLHRVVTQIKEMGMKVGVAINPHTPVLLLKDIVKYLDLALVMSVNPGFGGQSFIENTYQKIIELKQIANEQNTNLVIEVDGGVNLQNYSKLINAGADVIVVGNALFSSLNIIETINEFKK